MGEYLVPCSFEVEGGVLASVRTHLVGGSFKIEKGIHFNQEKM